MGGYLYVFMIIDDLGELLGFGGVQLWRSPGSSGTCDTPPNGVAL